MEQDKHQTSFKEKVAELCNIPKYAMLGYSIITFIGNSEVIIENHRGILEYNDESIRVMTKIGQLKIVGKRLNVLHYTTDELKIVGKITSITFV